MSSSALSVPLPLRLRPLLLEDLDNCTWAGSSVHLSHVAATLARVPSGEVVYLALVGAADLPLSIGSVDFAPLAGSGYVWQLATHPALRSSGLGSLLLSGLEAAARLRGCTQTELGVEDGNPRARSLYERKGYVAYSRELSSWQVEGPSGRPVPYSTWCTMLRKQL